MAAVKLVMTWDILPGREEEYFEYHIRNFLPTMEKLGIKMNEAWLTVYGDQPRLMAEAIMKNVGTANRVLSSPEWMDLGVELEGFVENFKFKVIPATKGFQL